MESLSNILTNFFTEGTNDILAGFLVPFIIWLFIKGYNFLTSINSYKKYSNLIGEYFFYHYSPTGRDEIIEGKLTIKSFMGHLSVIATSYEFKYTGSIEIERNLYIKLTATNFHEHWTFIFPEPTPIKQVESIWGIASGVSPIYEPVAYKVLLNRKPIRTYLRKKETNAKIR